jgi:hypothetical protein
MYLAKLRPADLAIALAVTSAACSPDVSTSPSHSPRTPAISAPALEVGSLDRQYTVQLRALPPNPILPPSPIYGWGHLQLRLGATLGDSCFPNDPLSPAPGTTLLTVCGRIFNEGGALYRGGAIYAGSIGLGDSPVFVAALNGAHPPEPCRRYDIGGAIVVADAIAEDMVTNPDRYYVAMDGDVLGTTTTISGLFTGTAWGPIGTRLESDAFFTAKVCNVVVTP